MGKAPLIIPKYRIVARFHVDAPVETQDVVGAIFGQTEGLFGDELDLKNLQRLGKIDRIRVNIEKKDEKGTEGTIIINSALNKEETALLAAALETVERIGPGKAEVVVERIEDVREEKRKYIMKRAKDLLKRMLEQAPKSSEVAEKIKGELKKELNLIEYEGYPAGKGIFDSDEIIVVEGRADVVNLIKQGITNVIGLNGINFDEKLFKLFEEKVVTLFVDGDRGGLLLAKEMANRAPIDYVAFAPSGREVEELSEKEIIKCLRKKKPASYLKSEYDPLEKKILMFKKDVKGKKCAILFDNEGNILARIPTKNIPEVIEKIENIYAVLVDRVTEEIIKTLKKKGIKKIITT